MGTVKPTIEDRQSCAKSDLAVSDEACSSILRRRRISCKQCTGCEATGFGRQGPATGSDSQTDNGTVVNAARFCVQASHQAREESQTRLRLTFFNLRQHFSNLTVDTSKRATDSLSMSDCGTGSSRPRGERSRLCLVFALVLLSAFLELKVDHSLCRSLMFADWKTAALDSSEVMKHAEVIFEMTSQ